jgi:hypothetical protein
MKVGGSGWSAGGVQGPRHGPQHAPGTRDLTRDRTRDLRKFGKKSCARPPDTRLDCTPVCSERRCGLPPGPSDIDRRDHPEPRCRTPVPPVVRLYRLRRVRNRLHGRRERHSGPRFGGGPFPWSSITAGAALRSDLGAVAPLFDPTADIRRASEVPSAVPGSVGGPRPGPEWLHETRPGMGGSRVRSKVRSKVWSRVASRNSPRNGRVPSQVQGQVQGLVPSPGRTLPRMKEHARAVVTMTLESAGPGLVLMNGSGPR